MKQEGKEESVHTITVTAKKRTAQKRIEIGYKAHKAKIHDRC